MVEKDNKEVKVEQKSNAESLSENELQVSSGTSIPPPPFQLKSESASKNQDQKSNVVSQMSSVFGTDFSNVNIHSNSSEAQNLSAQAFTKGNDIHFAPGKYNPKSEAGRQLIGHEFAHVVQQKQGLVNPTGSINGVNINTNEKLESEADEIGNEVAKFPYHDEVQSENATQFKKEYNSSELKNSKLAQMKSNFKGKDLDKNNLPIQSVSQFLCESGPTIENMEQVNTYLDRADTAISAGEIGFQAVGNSQAAERLTRARGYLSRVTGPMGRATEVLQHADRLSRLASTIDNLNSIDIQSNPQAAARQFDTLFTTIGEIGDAVPVLNAIPYFALLKETGTFFSDMQTLLDPATRPNARRYREFMP